MEFRGAEEILLENLEAPVNEIWYQDIKETPSIQLPERALVATKMSLLWKADRRDKPIYKRAPAATTAPKKVDMLKADVLKAEKKKGTRLESDSWCDYIVVSDSLEVLAPVALKKPKLESRDTADIPVLNPDDPIDLGRKKDGVRIVKLSDTTHRHARSP
ncbi:hypothetical protein Hanom_Chr08g00724111 [Helianthus anomalus]